MKYVKLGNSNIDVSVIALGCWQYGSVPYWGQQEEAESIASIRQALDEGINFFDTAEFYGDGVSEIVVGKALSERRDKAVIASKVNAAHLAAPDLIKACEDSLRRLNTDYLDLYQVHWPNQAVPLAETYEALQSLMKQGKVRAIGVSNFGIADMTELLAIGPVVTNQLPYSLLWRAIEFEVVAKCLENNIGILCYSPLAQGLLSGRYTCVDDVPEGRRCTRLFSSTRPLTRHAEAGGEAETFATIKDIKAISERLSVPMTSLALNWLLARPAVTSVLVGARSPEQVKMNIQALDFAINEALIRELNSVTAALKEKLGSNVDMWQSDSRIR